MFDLPTFGLTVFTVFFAIISLMTYFAFVLSEVILKKIRYYFYHAYAYNGSDYSNFRNLHVYKKHQSSLFVKIIHYVTKEPKPLNKES